PTARGRRELVSATSSGATAGAVLGIVIVLLAQQFAYLDLNPLGTAILYIVIGAIIGGVLCGVIGWALGRRYEKQHPEMFGSGGPSQTPPP
ncbi:MAG: hypothetical protein WB947_07780, partial [Thermoplasmata archaeon]